MVDKEEGVQHLCCSEIEERQSLLTIIVLAQIATKCLELVMLSCHSHSLPSYMFISLFRHIFRKLVMKDAPHI
jgi:hypothetical protein